MVNGSIGGPPGVGPLRPATPLGARAGARRAGPGAGFAVPEEAQEAQAALEATPLADVSLAAMLALQEVDSPTEQDRRARRHALDMLDALRDLQLDLLGEADSAERLQHLSRLARAVPAASHPGLRAAVAAVAMRVEVELARAGLAEAAAAQGRK